LRKKLRAFGAFVVVCSIGGLVLAPGGVGSVKEQVPADSLVRQIEHLRKTTWHWQRVMSRPLTAGSTSYRTDRSLRYRRWVRNLWLSRARRARRQAQNPPYRSVWLCIHRYEASWRDGGAPYYGGLQMDVSFQLHYGRRLYRLKGTADHWTPLEQMWVAERAYSSGRGFYPWPNTARYCGLI
jgi:hypothetical protein